jgi:hypothetical protein
VLYLAIIRSIVMDKGEMGGPAANNSSDFVSAKPDCLTDRSCTKSSIGP